MIIKKYMPTKNIISVKNLIKDFGIIMLNAQPLSATSHQMQFVGTWIIITFIVAVMRFKLVRE